MISHTGVTFVIAYSRFIVYIFYASFPRFFSRHIYLYEGDFNKRNL